VKIGKRNWRNIASSAEENGNPIRHKLYYLQAEDGDAQLVGASCCELADYKQKPLMPQVLNPLGERAPMRSISLLNQTVKQRVGMHTKVKVPETRRWRQIIQAEILLCIIEDILTQPKINSTKHGAVLARPAVDFSHHGKHPSIANIQCTLEHEFMCGVHNNKLLTWIPTFRCHKCG
jgi:hypothetical protein